MSASTAIVAAVLLPLGVAPLIALLGRRPNLREMATLLAGLGTFAFGLHLGAQSRRR